MYADGHKKHPHEAANGYTSSSEQSGEARPKFIKTIYKQGSQVRPQSAPDPQFV